MAKKRSPYKRYLKDPDRNLPRQTKSSRRRLDDGGILELQDQTSDTDSTGSTSTDTLSALESHSITAESMSSSSSDGNSSVETVGNFVFNDSDSIDGQSLNDDTDSDDSDVLIDDLMDSHISAEGFIDAEETVTKQNLIVLILAYVQKHNLTHDALGDLLSLLNLVKPDVVPSSKYLFYKQCHHESFQKHYFCRECNFYFGENTSTDELCQCNNGENTIEKAKQNATYFCYWPIESQLKILLHDDTIKEHIYDKQGKTNNEGDICDIVDGDLFNNIINDDNPFHTITLLWNFDGVPLFKSANKELWPIQCQINQLPVDLRRKHILMPGLWFSDTKVITSALLKPFVAELEKLSSIGMLFLCHVCTLI